MHTEPLSKDWKIYWFQVSKNNLCSIISWLWSWVESLVVIFSKNTYFTELVLKSHLTNNNQRRAATTNGEGENLISKVAHYIIWNVQVSTNICHFMTHAEKQEGMTNKQVQKKSINCNSLSERKREKPLLPYYLQSFDCKLILSRREKGKSLPWNSSKHLAPGEDKFYCPINGSWWLPV